MNAAVAEVRNLVAGKPGGFNAFMNRWGKLLVDYATALIPDRDAPFDQLLEDLLADAISQARAISNATSEEQVRAFIIESALRTVRARYRAQLDAPAAPTKATTTFTVDQIVKRTNMKPEQITAGISEGSIRAIRRDNEMRVQGADVPGMARANSKAWRVSAAQRELLCLRYRLLLSPAEIGRFSGSSPGHIESLVEEAAARMADGKAGHPTLPKADSEMRRYIDGQLDHDETSRFENRVLKDKASQHRLDQLRGQHDEMRELFDSPAFDLSRVAVNVRERNPHQPLAIPPVAALWLQAVGVAALVLLLHRVGAYLPPPDVRLDVTEGSVSIDDGRPPSALSDGRIVVGQSISTAEGGQAALAVDASNRVRLAGGTKVTLREPRPSVRQVLQLDHGEIWARFISTGHAFSVIAGVDANAEVTSENAAEFGLALGVHAFKALPDNLGAEQAAAFAAMFTPAGGGISPTRAFSTMAGFIVGENGDGLLAGDVLRQIDEITIEQPDTLRSALAALPPGQAARISILRNGAAMQLALRRVNAEPAMVLRVYRGSVFVAQKDLEPEQVNRGQWALMTPGQPLLIGQRGIEDFRLLRMDSADRFKDRLHWLNTESFPLRSENNLLLVERELRALASRLERLRAEEVLRDGATEIARFEEVMAASIAAAKERIDTDQAQPRGLLASALGDAEIVAAESEIMAAIAHWKRQSTSGAWATLGSAGKTLHGRIQRDLDAAQELEASLDRANKMKAELARTLEAMGIQSAEIDKLKASPLHDADGAMRKEIDAQVEHLNTTVKVGAEAATRIELILLKLNELDAQLDDLRRRLPTARGELAGAELLLKEIDDKLAANIYTPAALGAAEAAQTAATQDAAAKAKALADREKEFASADSALAIARTTLGKAENAALAPAAARDKAQDALTDAVASRTAAQKARDDASTEVDALKAAYDALPENDPGRAEAKLTLDAAQAELAQAEKDLTQASDAATAAKKTFDAAEAKSKAATKLVEDAKAAHAKAEQDREAALASRDQADRESSAAKKAERDTTTRVAEFKAARTERELLDTRRAEATERLNAARAGLEKLEKEIADVDADAEPRRQKLAEERRLVEAAAEASSRIDELKVKRDQHQAISDEIALRGRDLAELDKQRNQLAESDLVKNYDALVLECSQLLARSDAMKFLQDRALKEDENFALAQQAAKDRYREAATETTTQAVALLDKACLPYGGFALADTETDAALIRGRLMETMWKLYYEPGIDAADDGQAVVCYYVIQQARGSDDQFRVIDDRWKLALAQVFDKARFEKASNLQTKDLGAPAADGEGN